MINSLLILTLFCGTSALTDSIASPADTVVADSGTTTETQPVIDSISVEGEVVDSTTSGLARTDTLTVMVNSLQVGLDTLYKFSSRVPRTAEYAIRIFRGTELLFSANVPDDSLNPDIFITCVLVSRQPGKKPPLSDSVKPADTVVIQKVNEIVVSAVRHGTPAAVPVATVTITRKQLLRTTGTANDPIRALNTIPGVAAESDASAMPIIRGGDLEESRVFLDEIPLLQPFHFGGVRSMFNTATVDNLTLYKSGFPAKYHNAASGLIVVNTRSPARDSAIVCGDLNVLQYNAYTGIPLKNHSLGISLAAQGSYVDFMAKRITDIAILTMQDSVERHNAARSKSLINMPDYQDFSAGIEWRPPGSKFSVTLNNLYATDKVKFTQGDSVTPATYHYGNKYYYNDPQSGLVFYDGLTGDPAYDALLRDTSFSCTVQEGWYTWSSSPYGLSPDSVTYGRSYYKTDTTLAYASSFNILYSQSRYARSPDQIFTLSLASQRRRWDLKFPVMESSRYDVKLDQWNANAGMLYTAINSHRLHAGLQWDMTESRFNVYTLRMIHEIISKGSTNFGDYWGPVSGDSGLVFSNEQNDLFSLDIMGQLYVEYKGERISHSISAYAEDEWTPDPRLTINYGGRIEGSTADRAATFSPRISTKYALTPRHEVCGAAGLYTQNNYDVAALALSEHLKPEKAWHASCGLESGLRPWLTQKIDLFGKYYYDLASEVIDPVGSPGALLSDAERYFRDSGSVNIDSLLVADPEEYSRLIQWYIFRVASFRSRYSNDGRGWAAGAEYMLRYDPFDFWNGWISLTLGKSRRQRHPGWRWHDFSLDRPVLISLVNYYRLPRKYEIGLKYRYMSGIPYTDTDLEGTLRIGAYNARRYAHYQALDVRISRRFSVRKQQCHFYIEGLNILNSPNFFLNDSKTRVLKMPGMNLPVPVLYIGLDINI